MNSRDPKLTALLFNQCVNDHDVEGLAQLMTDDHTFIDREGNTHRSREFMVQSWKRFFLMFPDYRNNFTRVVARENHVLILGFAYWSADKPYDPAIWMVTVDGDLVSKWRIYEDTDENRRMFGLDEGGTRQ
jgi:hypothetical protein